MNRQWLALLLLGIFCAAAKGTPTAADPAPWLQVTKTLAAVGLLCLGSHGRLDLDAPVEALLVGIRFDNPRRGRREITQRHLLDHTAGVGDLRLRQMFTLHSDPNAPLVDTFSRDASHLQVRSQPAK